VESKSDEMVKINIIVFTLDMETSASFLKAIELLEKAKFLPGQVDNQKCGGENG
jgi:hypothetical protein